MLQSVLKIGLAASLISLYATSVSASAVAAGFAVAQTSSGPKAITTLGCYSNVDPLTEQGTWTFQTSGYCQGQCAQLNMPVMATTQGSTCYCGNEIPAQSSITSNSSCNTACDGYDLENCGGTNVWTVYLTGITDNVPTVGGSSSSSSSTSSTSTAPSVVVTTKSAGQTTIVATVTASSTNQSDAQSTASAGSSKVGIAVGVVVGLLAVATIVGGTIIYLKQRRKRAVEEEYRRNASVQQFIQGGTPETRSTNDQRLEPGVFAQPNPRQSIGSIADERDFSRRILQVRNPDAIRDSVA